MTPLVLLTPDHGFGPLVLARRARLRERLIARFATYSLDEELARGVAPGARATLALRAHALGEPEMRRGLATQLRRVLHDARTGRRRSLAQIPTVRGEILGAAEELEALAERLLAPVLWVPAASLRSCCSYATAGARCTGTARARTCATPPPARSNPSNRRSCGDCDPPLLCLRYKARTQDRTRCRWIPLASPRPSVQNARPSARRDAPGNHPRGQVLARR
jgi:hypothetical protein